MESRVAVLLTEGKSLREVAAATGRKETTIRWHLRQIFAKRGIARQAEPGWPLVVPPHAAHTGGTRAEYPRATLTHSTWAGDMDRTCQAGTAEELSQRLVPGVSLRPIARGVGTGGDPGLPALFDEGEAAETSSTLVIVVAALRFLSLVTRAYVSPRCPSTSPRTRSTGTCCRSISPTGAGWPTRMPRCHRG